ncbi:MAG TPA: 4Fe-4S binding protein [Clostridiales bacterium]|nr:4Fe-4S binding protein [Clostridiales bacterium]
MTASDMCTGCGACVAVCPIGAIKLLPNSEGFLRPVKQDNCIDCGLCKKIQNISVDVKTKDANAFCIYSNSAEILKKSTSGAVAFGLSVMLFNKGYNIVGAIYDANTDTAKHIIAKNIADIQNMRGSKYIQSHTVEAFNKIVYDKSGAKYAVFALPCQIAGLKLILEELNPEALENVLFIDLFCHGVPSNNLWQNYLASIRNKKDIGKIDSINFRSKKSGWGKYTLEIRDINGNEFSSTEDSGLYFRMYIRNIALQNSCYTCKYRGATSEADIKLGDFWQRGIEAKGEGMSSVLTFSQKGYDAINELADFTIKPLDNSTVLSAQLNQDIPIPNIRQEILNSLANEPFDKTIKMFNKYERKQELTRKIKKLGELLKG